MGPPHSVPAEKKKYKHSRQSKASKRAHEERYGKFSDRKKNRSPSSPASSCSGTSSGSPSTNSLMSDDDEACSPRTEAASPDQEALENVNGQGFEATASTSMLASSLASSPLDTTTAATFLSSFNPLSSPSNNSGIFLTVIFLSSFL